MSQTESEALASPRGPGLHRTLTSVSSSSTLVGGGESSSTAADALASPSTGPSPVKVYGRGQPIVEPAGSGSGSRGGSAPGLRVEAIGTSGNPIPVLNDILEIQKVAPPARMTQDVPGDYVSQWGGLCVWCEWGMAAARVWQ
jgi:hypothetical protein